MPVAARPVEPGEDLEGQVLLVRVRCRGVHRAAGLACVRMIEPQPSGFQLFRADVIPLAAIAGIELDPPADEALVPR